MPQLPAIIPPRPWTVPPLLVSAGKGVRAFVGAMTDEALVLILTGVVILARLAWMFGAACFVAAGVMSLAFWFNGMAGDAWRAAYAGALSLAIMAVARFIQSACIRYRSRDAAF